MEPKTEKERDIIKNEVGIMILCAEETDSILKCFEVFDYRERLWIFMEYMDGGCLTPIVEECNGEISENICAYILW
jgi:serine/threonine protein kinase